MYTVEIKVPEKQFGSNEQIKAQIQNAFPGSTVKAYIGHLGVLSIQPNPSASDRSQIENIVNSFRQ
jgi:hypothetical protein